MQLPLTSLPSEGFGVETDQSYIDIKPLTWKEVRKYNQFKYDGALDSLIWDIETLVQGIEGWEKLSSYDLSAIIFTRKYISATFNGSLKVAMKNKVYEIPMADITFKEMLGDLKNIEEIIINNERLKFRIPNILNYYMDLKSVVGDPVYSDDSYMQTLYLASCLIPADMVENEAIDYQAAFLKVLPIIDSATQEDIVVLETLSDQLNDLYNDVTVKSEGGETVVKIKNLTADIFRLIKLNSPTAAEHIKYRGEIRD